MWAVVRISASCSSVNTRRSSAACWASVCLRPTCEQQHGNNVNHSVWNYWQLRIWLLWSCRRARSYKTWVVGLKRRLGCFGTHGSTLKVLFTEYPSHCWLLIIEEECWSLFCSIREVSSSLRLWQVELLIYRGKKELVAYKDEDIVIKANKCCHRFSSSSESSQAKTQPNTSVVNALFTVLLCLLLVNVWFSSKTRRVR